MRGSANNNTNRRASKQQAYDYPDFNQDITNKDPNTARQIEKLFLLTAEVRTLKIENFALLNKIEELQKNKESNTMTPNMIREYTDKYTKKIEALEEEVRYLKETNKAKTNPNSNVHLRVLEDQNIALRAKVKEVIDEMDHIKERHERRLIEIGKEHKRVLDELNSYKNRYRSPNNDRDVEDHRKHQSYNPSKSDTLLVDKLKKDKARLKQQLRDFIDKANSDRVEIEEVNNGLKEELAKVKKEFGRKESDLVVRLSKMERQYESAERKQVDIDKENTKNEFFNKKIEELKEEIAKLRTENLSLNETKLEIDAEKNNLKHELNLLKLDNTQTLKDPNEEEARVNEIEHLRNLLEIQEGKLKEANDIIKNKNRTIEKLVDKSINLEEEGTDDQSINSPFFELERQINNMVKDTVADKQVEQNLIKQEIDIMKKINDINNNEIRQIDDEIELNEKLLRYGKSAKGEKEEQSIRNMIDKEKNNKLEFVKTLQNKKKSLEEANKFQGKTIECLNGQIGDLNKMIEKLADKLANNYIENNIDPQIKRDRLGNLSFYNSYMRNKLIAIKEDELRDKANEVDSLRKRNNLMCDKIEQRKENLKEKKDKLKSIGIGKKDGALKEREFDQNEYETEILNNEINHLHRLNKSNKDNLDRSKKVLSNKRKEIGEYLDKLDRALEKELRQLSTSTPFNKNNVFTHPSFKNPKEDLKMTINTNKSPKFSYIKPEPIHTEFDANEYNNSLNDSPYAVQNLDLVKQYSDNAIVLNDEIKSLRKKNSDLLKKFNSKNREDSEISESQDISRIRKGNEPYSKQAYDINGDPIDARKLAKIMQQKPFYVADLNDVPNRMLEMANQIEELKYDKKRLTKEKDKYRDRTDYLTKENDIIKRSLQGSQLKTDLIMAGELDGLKANLNSIADKSEALLLENDDLLKKIDKLKRENNQLKAERDLDFQKNVFEKSELSSNLKQTDKQLKRLEDENRELHLKNRRLVKEIEDLSDQTVIKEEYDRLKREHKNLLNDLYTAKEDVKGLKLENTDLKYELSHLKNNLGVNELDSKRLETILRHKEKENDYLKDKLNEYETKLKDAMNTSIQEINDLKSKSENLKLSKQDLENIIRLKDKEIAHLKERLDDDDLLARKESEGVRKYIDKLQNDQEDYERKINELKAQLEQKNSELLKKLRLINELEEQLKTLKAKQRQIDTLKNDKGRLKDELEEKDQYINNMNDELEGIKPIVQDFQNLKENTKNIKKELDKYKDFYVEYKDKIKGFRQERKEMTDQLNRAITKADEMEKSNERKVEIIARLQIKAAILFMELDRINRKQTGGNIGDRVRNDSYTRYRR